MKLSDEMAVQSANWSSVLDTRAKAELVLGDVMDWASRVARLERVATVAEVVAKECSSYILEEDWDDLFIDVSRKNIRLLVEALKELEE